LEDSKRVGGRGGASWTAASLLLEDDESGNNQRTFNLKIKNVRGEAPRGKKVTKNLFLKIKPEVNPPQKLINPPTKKQHLVEITTACGRNA